MEDEVDTYIEIVNITLRNNQLCTKLDIDNFDCNDQGLIAQVVTELELAKQAFLQKYEEGGVELDFGDGE